jgi:CO dehydrogenase nickel-insertion accessory protein CooC1
METVRRIVELATDLGTGRVLVIANKVRDESDRDAITEFSQAHGFELAAEIPFDPLILEAERAGAAPFDYRRESPAMTAVGALARSLRTTIA